MPKCRHGCDNPEYGMYWYEDLQMWICSSCYCTFNVYPVSRPLLMSAGRECPAGQAELPKEAPHAG